MKINLCRQAAVKHRNVPLRQKYPCVWKLIYIPPEAVKVYESSAKEE